MIRILYFSQSAHNITDQQVQQILNSSRQNGGIKGDPLQFHHISILREQRCESIQPKAFTAGMNEFLKMLNAGHHADPASVGKPLE